MFLFWSLAANELLKAVQTIPPQNTHCLFLKKKKKKKKKEKHLFYYFFRCAGKDKFEKSPLFSFLFFSAFSSYQLLLFRTLCVCVCCENYTNKEDASCCCFLFRLSAGRNSGRTDSCLKQLKNIFFFFFFVFLFFSKSSQQTNNNKTVLFYLVQSAHLWRSRHKTAAHRR